LLTGGGYLGHMRSLGSIGIDILSNHHVLSEQLTQKRLLSAVAGSGDADGQKLMVAPSLDDPVFAGELDAALAKLGPEPERGEFGLALTRALIETSSHEGDAVYRATRSIANPVLRTRNGHYDDVGFDPDKWILPRDSSNEAYYRDFFDLEERSFRRVGTVLRRWVALQKKALSVEKPDDRAFLRSVALERLITRQLRMMDQQEARLADYVKHPPEASLTPERSPILLVADLVLLFVVGLPILLIVRRQRRKAQAAKPTPPAGK